MRTILSVALAAAFIIPSAAPESWGQKVTIEKQEFYGQPNSYRLSNATVDVFVTTDIGPRIMGYRLKNGENILAEMDTEAGEVTDFGKWRPYGGHRLWHAPEVVPRSYVPDSEPVNYEIKDNSIRLTQKTEAQTGIQKEMLVTLADSGSEVTILHTLTNHGQWDVELAPWALTIMRGGGTEIIPNEPYISHTEKKLPARPLVLWNYTDLSDPRLTYGPKFTRLATDSNRNNPIKLGVLNTLGWAGYALGGNLFIKRFPYVEGADYPDMGCNFETFTTGDFMELESLGPLVKLAPGASVSHEEKWNLVSGFTVPEKDEELSEALKTVFEQIGLK